MRSRSVIYNDLLTYQADLSWDLERSFFRNTRTWTKAESVLDFGAGNACYAAKLASWCPEKTFWGIERDTALVQVSDHFWHRCGVALLAPTYAEFPGHRKFDFVLARHTISYLPDRAEFFKWIAAHTTPNAGVLIIDAIDDAFWAWPSLPHLERGNEEFKESVKDSGGNRNLLETLQREMATVGFQHHMTTRLTVHSDIAGRKEPMFRFMNAVAEYDHGSPLPGEIRAELDGWFQDPRSYLQYGLFGASFERQSTP